METRNLRESDHGRIVSVVDEWWGRPMTSNLPRLFFRHFEDTSYVVEENGELIAFLIGFVSRSRANEAYIHFVGVAPEHRGRGVAHGLYRRFFEEAHRHGCEMIRCITSPVNEASIAFHRKLGFALEDGDSMDDGVPFYSDYDGEGADRVVFTREILTDPLD